MKRRLFLQSSVAAAVATALPVRTALAALAEVTGNVNAVTGDGAQVTFTGFDIDGGGEGGVGVGGGVGAGLFLAPPAPEEPRD